MPGRTSCPHFALPPRPPPPVFPPQVCRIVRLPQAMRSASPSCCRTRKHAPAVRCFVEVMRVHLESVSPCMRSFLRDSRCYPDIGSPPFSSSLPSYLTARVRRTKRPRTTIGRRFAPVRRTARCCRYRCRRTSFSQRRSTIALRYAHPAPHRVLSRLCRPPAPCIYRCWDLSLALSAPSMQFLPSSLLSVRQLEYAREQRRGASHCEEGFTKST